MARLATQRIMVGRSSFVLLIGVSACGAGTTDPTPESSSTLPTDIVSSTLGRTTGQDGPCDTVSAGDGWVNTFIPRSTGEFSVQLRNYPGSSATPPLIDTVVGLSNGPADSFADLGPIVRFNEHGQIDARDGDHYVGGFPYRTADGPFEFLMNVSIPTHRYTVWVRHLDSPFKTFELLGDCLLYTSPSPRDS